MDEFTRQKVQKLFAEQNAIVVGDHFAYTPKEGRWFHGYDYISKEVLCADPQTAEKLAQIIAVKAFSFGDFDTVVGIADGTIGLALLVGLVINKLQFRKQRVQVCYASKQGQDFVLKGIFYQYIAGKKVLIVEDVLNSGGSAKKVVQAVQKIGGEVAVLFALCNRGKVTKEMVGNVPFYALMDVAMEMFPAENCPICKERGINSIRLDLGKGRDYLKSLVKEELKI